MASYGATTKKSPEEVIRRAKAFFGVGGLGLGITEDAPCCACFSAGCTPSAGGGHVRVSASSGERGTEVAIETREWDQQVKLFLGKIH